MKLQKLIDYILEMNHTDAEWIALQKRAESIKNELSEMELRYFAESGAGEALYMACSGMNM